MNEYLIKYQSTGNIHTLIVKAKDAQTAWEMVRRNTNFILIDIHKI